MPQETSKAGNAPNQFAQVGMGGSQGGGQFEQGEGQSGSLQDQQGGTTTTESVPLDHDHEVGDQQEQSHPRELRAPGSSEEEDGDFGSGASPAR